MPNDSSPSGSPAAASGATTQLDESYRQLLVERKGRLLSRIGDLESDVKQIDALLEADLRASPAAPAGAASGPRSPVDGAPTDEQLAGFCDTQAKTHDYLCIPRGHSPTAEVFRVIAARLRASAAPDAAGREDTASAAPAGAERELPKPLVWAPRSARNDPEFWIAVLREEGWDYAADTFASLPVARASSASSGGTTPSEERQHRDDCPMSPRLRGKYGDPWCNCGASPVAQPDAPSEEREWLLEAARYIRDAADGESDHYRRTDYGPPPEGFEDEPAMGEVIGYGPCGPEIAEHLESLAARLSASPPSGARTDGDVQ